MKGNETKPLEKRIIANGTTCFKIQVYYHFAVSLYK